MQQDQTQSLDASNKRKRNWGILCLVMPFALTIIIIFLYAVTNFIAATVTPASPHGGDAIFYQTPIWAKILNVVYFAIGGIAAISIIPGIIIGIILLSTRKRPSQT